MLGVVWMMLAMLVSMVVACATRTRVCSAVFGHQSSQSITKAIEVSHISVASSSSRAQRKPPTVASASSRAQHKPPQRKATPMVACASLSSAKPIVGKFDVSTPNDRAKWLPSATLRKAKNCVNAKADEKRMPCSQQGGDNPIVALIRLCVGVQVELHVSESALFS